MEPVSVSITAFLYTDDTIRVSPAPNGSDAISLLQVGTYRAMYLLVANVISARTPKMQFIRFNNSSMKVHLDHRFTYTRPSVLLALATPPLTHLCRVS